MFKRENNQVQKELDLLNRLKQYILEGDIEEINYSVKFIPKLLQHDFIKTPQIFQEQQKSINNLETNIIQLCKNTLIEIKGEEPLEDVTIKIKELETREIIKKRNFWFSLTIFVEQVSNLKESSPIKYVDLQKSDMHQLLIFVNNSLNQSVANLIDIDIPRKENLMEVLSQDGENVCRLLQAFEKENFENQNFVSDEYLLPFERLSYQFLQEKDQSSILQIYDTIQNWEDDMNGQIII